MKNVIKIFCEGKVFDIVMSIPTTFWFNCRYLPLRQAVKLPVWVHYKCKYSIQGRLILPSSLQTALIRLGFHKVPAKSSGDETMIVIKRGGALVFEGSAHLGRGSRLYVEDGAELILGDNFAISASSAILCYKKIQFGRDIQFSWDCLVMDSDTHKIYNQDGNRINEDAPIVFGDKIWIGCRSTILKGCVIPSNCVIGSCSLVTTKRLLSNTIIAGHPARIIKDIRGWDL